MKAKTKKAMRVGVIHTSGDGNPLLLQAAEQFLTEHYFTEAAVTAQWHTEGAGSWIKSYAARLSHIQGYSPYTNEASKTHNASVAAWRVPKAQEPQLTTTRTPRGGGMAKARTHTGQVEYDTTPVPTAVQIGVTDVQEMVHDMNSTLENEVTVTEDDPDAPGGKTYEIVSKLMRDQGLQGDPKEFIPGYYKELHTVTTLRLKPVSPEVAAYIRSKKLAVWLKMLYWR